MSVLYEAREKCGFKNVWTYDGWILYKNNNDGQKIKIYGKKIRLYIFCYLNSLLFSLRGSENRIFISDKFLAFGNAPLMLRIICKTLLIFFIL